MPPLRVNLSGEGEVPDVLNQNIRRIAEPGWISSRAQRERGSRTMNSYYWMLSLAAIAGGIFGAALAIA